MDRDDLRGFVEFDLPQGYLLNVGYRTVDYSEDTTRYDDYDADIAEVSVGYRW